LWAQLDTHSLSNKSKTICQLVPVKQPIADA